MRDAGLEEATRVAGSANALARDSGIAFGGIMDEIDTARAQEYALLATLLARAPDAQLFLRLAGLQGDATPLGLAHVALAEAASPEVEAEIRAFLGRGGEKLTRFGVGFLAKMVFSCLVDADFLGVIAARLGCGRLGWGQLGDQGGDGGG